MLASLIKNFIVLFKDDKFTLIRHMFQQLQLLIHMFDKLV